ncbi:hypothetical protein CLOM621_05472 [Clostridium sp. M62/1]|nr:hypothetical protein CLOM621_05472 [Clostridium sp. M62/1]
MNSRAYNQFKAGTLQNNTKDTVYPETAFTIASKSFRGGCRDIFLRTMEKFRHRIFD